MKNSKSESYAAAGVDITAGYKAVELMKKHIGRTKNEGCLVLYGFFIFFKQGVIVQHTF